MIASNERVLIFALHSAFLPASWPAGGAAGSATCPWTSMQGPGTPTRAFDCHASTFERLAQGGHAQMAGSEGNALRPASSPRSTLPARVTA